MRSPYSAFADLPDDELLAEVTRLATCERQATADLVASLVVLDERRLYLREGYPSLFGYCTGALHFAEGAAYLRIEAARAARRFPTILDRLALGAITLTGIKLLAPHLTEGNHLVVLEAARGKTTREIEQLVAHLAPRPDVPAVVRKLPVRPVACSAPASLLPPALTPLAPATASANAEPPVGAPAAVPGALDLDAPAAVSLAVPPPRPAVVVPLAPARYKVQMTIGAETHERLRRVQALLRHTIPDGDLAAIFDQALVLLLERLERQKWAARKARRAAAGDPAKPTGAHAEPRKERRRTPREANESGALTAGATAGAAQPPGGGSRPGPATCPVIPCGEQPAGPAAGAGELVAQRVGVAEGHALRSQPDPALSESKAGVPCALVTRSEQPAGPAACEPELVAQRVGAANGPAVQLQPDPACSESTTGTPACSPGPCHEGAATAAAGARELVAQRVGPPARPPVTCREPPDSPAAARELVAQRVGPPDGEAARARPRGERAAPEAERARSRRIPAAVRRAVWLRANGQCTYVSPAGQRCPARSRLEFHHAVPYADGGHADVEGITLLCAAHHARETERWFGERPARGGSLLHP